MRTTLQSARLPVGGFIAAHVSGRAQGRSQVFRVEAIYEEDRQYWANGLAPAAAARMIAESRQIEKGVHYLADAVAPVAFVTELRKSGLEAAENFGPAPAV
jgi:hypothetical protein